MEPNLFNISWDAFGLFGYNLTISLYQIQNGNETFIDIVAGNVDSQTQGLFMWPLSGNIPAGSDYFFKAELISNQELPYDFIHLPANGTSFQWEGRKSI